MKIKNSIIYLLLVLSVISISSCDEGGKPDPGKTTTGDFAGDWYINLKDETGAVVANNEIHSTYNTAANDNTMWIDDHLHGYALKCKITVNLTDGTFTAVAQPNIIDSGTVTITDGKFEKGAGISKGGHVVDKISFKAHFSYDPATTIISYVGTKRTGFKEDEY